MSKGPDLPTLYAWTPRSDVAGARLESGRGTDRHDADEKDETV